MSTGYTAIFEKGDISFPEFAMRCARAFGALMSLREESLDAPIPERIELSTYYTEAMESAEEKLIEISNLTDFEANILAEEAYRLLCDSYWKSVEKLNKLKEKYENMLIQVENWIPPTPKHNGLKEFMIQQLRDSIRWDCLYNLDAPVKLSGTDYKRQEMRKIQKNIDYYKEEYRRELERTLENNNWLSALRDSM